MEKASPVNAATSATCSQLPRSVRYIYIEHDVWFTNKCHVIIDHVPQAIERTGRGLLGNSEQVVEASHAIFDRFWKKYLVVDLESDTHGERLLQCVIDFDSSNI